MNGIVKRIVVDRTFVDDDNVRWIIDYKTGDHKGSDVDAFLDTEEERYTEQLVRYVDIVSRVEKREVKAALYFPMLKAWRVIGAIENAPGTPGQQELF